MSTSEDSYRMPRSSTEAKRLDEQSRVFQTSLDYLIHPSIASTLPASPTIADIGCGTGSYLVDLSTTLPPTSHLHGFDISPAQFRNTLPPNVTLTTADVKSPFPAQWHGKFDMVHLRLLVAAMDARDWALALRNVLALLKPGGAIQWEEADFMTGRRLRGGGAHTTAANLAFALQPMVERFSDRYAYGYSTLRREFEDAGMERVALDVVSSDRLFENRRIMGLLSIQAVFEWARRERERGGGDFWPGRTLEEVERKAYEDLEGGAYAQFDIYCTVGFK